MQATVFARRLAAALLAPHGPPSWTPVLWYSASAAAGSFASSATVPPLPPPLPSPPPPGGASTIFALSSGPGRAAVAIVRLSGPSCDAALQRLLAPDSALPPPRMASLRSLWTPDGGLLDKALVLRLPGPRSFTGEDCAELHLHGSPAVVRAVLEALGSMRELRLRPAEAGEFARRAFEAGKLDLTQVEGLADLLAAETESQRRQALLHSTGVVRRMYEQWRSTLLTCLARLEAVIDFGEDEGIADDVAAGVLPLVRDLRASLEGHLAAASCGELVRSGVNIAIVGPPNAGKSSLLNLLAGHEAAIVSPVAGTTRDTVSVSLELGGVKVILTDSAGLRATDCDIEREGVRRAVAAAQRADLVLHVADASRVLPGGGSGSAEADADEPGPPLELPPHAVQLTVLNKADLLGGDAAAAAAGGAAGAHVISCSTGQGIEQLLAALQQAVLELVGRTGDAGFSGALVVRARHRHHLSEAIEAMLRYEACGAEVELACEELRAAARALGRVVGILDVEAVLEELYSAFCVGK